MNARPCKLLLAIAAFLIPSIASDAETIQVTVESQFGVIEVSPNVGTSLVAFDDSGGTAVDFSAPEHVYLDRYMNELGTDASQISDFAQRAYYRARNVGYAIRLGRDTQAVSNTARFFTQQPNDDIAVIWNWEIDFAGTIDLGTGSLDGLSDADASDTAAGLVWYGVTNQVANLDSRFNSTVNASVGDAGGTTRFAAKGYILEGGPNPAERSVVFSGKADRLVAADTGVDWAATTDFTYEFWARRDPSDTGASAVLSIGHTSHTAAWLGWAANGNLIMLGGGLHIEYDGASDSDWHHWAFVFDDSEGLFTLYRDGEPVKTSSEVYSLDPKDIVTIGGRTNADGSLIDHFIGGVNNVRIWETVRTADEIAESMATLEYGSVENLSLELTFDTADAVTSGQGLSAELWIGDSSSIIHSVDEITTTWTRGATTTETNFTFPSGVPATFFGLIYTGKIQIDETGFYNFFLRTDGGSTLLVDGAVVVDNDGRHSDAVEVEGVAVPLAKGLHDIQLNYFQDNGAKSIDVQYQSGGQGIVKQSIPDGNLFVSDPIITMTTMSSEGLDINFEFKNFDRPFPDFVETDEQIAALFPGFHSSNGVDGSGELNAATAEGESSFDITDWVRASWVWTEQFKLEVKVAASNSDALTSVMGLPFLSGDIEIDAATSGSSSQDGTLVATTITEWVDAGSDVTVGTRYKSADGLYRLVAINGQLNAFGSITMNTLVDEEFPLGAAGAVAARRFHLTSSGGLSAGGSLTFIYGDVVHFAEIEIGEGLDVSSDAQLTPDLGGASLAITQQGPRVTGFPQGSTDGTATGGSGDPYVWDFVGQKFYPLEPGAYTLVWPDMADPGKTYTIEITAGFADETVTLYNRENADGTLQGSAPDYAVEFTFPAISDEYPAAPGAHYHYVVSDAQDSIPVELDRLPLDRWQFQRMAYSETTGALVEQGSTIFTSTDVGQRSVLVYSYRPDPTEVANGDLSKEAIVVRVIETTATEDVTVGSGDLAVDGRQHLRLDSATGLYAQTQGGGFNFGIGNNKSLTWEFWVRLDEADESSSDSRIIFEIEVQDEQGLFQFGVRPLDATTNPGGYFIALKDVANSFAETLSVELDRVEVDEEWHHWALAFDGTILTVFRDGARVANSDFPISYAEPTQNNFHHYGYSPVEAGGWMNGEIDNLRVWSRVLTLAEVRQSMLVAKPALDSAPAFNVIFDRGASGAIVVKESGGSATGNLEMLEAADDSDGLAANALVDQSDDFYAEVATRILSKLDTARIGSGFLLNPTSNYNPGIYQRGADPGAWGPVYPVNWAGLYQADGTELHIAYYENPSRSTVAGNPLTDAEVILHPNVDWPYVVVDYDAVEFPSEGIHADSRIYIASRLGSEGVDASGSDSQVLFNPALYANLVIYNQPDPAAVGFNPNEEHALVSRSLKAVLTGDSTFNFQQNAAYALQNNLNHWGENDSDTSSNDNDADDFTSEPWVLLQYVNITTGEMEMAAYEVMQTRSGTTGQAFPLDILDADTHLPDLDLYAALTDPIYAFEYPIFAGDLLIPPYPLSVSVGSLIMEENTGGNIGSQRTLWNDKDQIVWAVSGDGRFFYENWYPLSADFWFDFDGDGVNDAVLGTPISWLPEPESVSGVVQPQLVASDFTVTEGGGSPSAVNTFYTSFWRDDYPVLKRGESVTYAGGENKAENPLDDGLPGILAWASAELIYDSLTPSMVIDDLTALDYTARVTRPLDLYPVDFGNEELTDIELTPAYADRVMVVGTRWYFKELSGSLQKRFYYDSLFGRLVLRGRVNNLESGDPNLTVTPVSLSILEANVMSADDFAAMLALGSDSSAWVTAVTDLYTMAQNPSSLSNVTPSEDASESPGYWPGLESPGGDQSSQFDFYTEGVDGVTFDSAADDGTFEHLDSLGTGSALVPNPVLLSQEPAGALYVTVVENNHPEVSGAIALHVIEISEARFRGAIEVVEAQDVFDEKIELRHTGDFGGNTEGVYYQWWVRDTAPLAAVGLPDDGSDSRWQLLQAGLGLDGITFTGRPDITLADKFFYVRYGEAGEFGDIDNVSSSDWRLVDINDASDSYSKDSDTAVPFQWAGASNSPQLQADGSKDYIPQLVMGWVKRVLDRINPYEARFTDFTNNDSPSTISSMIQIAGAPYIGDVALNSDKNVIEGVGLIELYETVLNRAKSLTLDVNNPSEGTNQALLLAATRLASLYDLLAREAFSDAQNPTIVVTPENGLASTAPFVFSFQNQVATLAHEELALLRGTDFLKSYPSYNRLFWNYVKGLGEAAYNANYAIWDVNVDGFINEFDAAEIYPQGHGDAWGHFLSASTMHYALLRAPGFDWLARSEFYSLLDNVLPADYLDEKSFARIAAAKARTGKQIVDATYRQAYTADPAGQWQGYTDSAQPARAWGVSEWANRAGQGAIYDWVIGNALVPLDAENLPDADELGLDSSSGLNQIDRQANRMELAEIAAAFAGIQNTLDSANGGNNPLGLDPNGIVFDLDPFLDGRLWERATHFEQIYERAVSAGQNALATLDFATEARQQLNRLTSNTVDLQREAILQDISYRNRLIEIFGTPYEGTIGPGELYDEGYTGPDTLLYLYIDQIDAEALIPASPGLDGDGGTVSRFVTVLDGMEDFKNSLNQLDFSSDIGGVSGSFDPGDNPFNSIFDDLFLTEDPEEFVLNGGDLTVEVPVVTTGDYAFQAADGWGRRGAYGRIQIALNKMLAAEIDLKLSIDAYSEYVDGLEILNERVNLQIELLEGKQGARLEFKGGLITVKTLQLVAEEIADGLEKVIKSIETITEAVITFVPTVEGLSTDVFSGLRGSIALVSDEASISFRVAQQVAEVSAKSLEFGADIQELRHELDEERFEEYQEILNLLTELADQMRVEEIKRDAIAVPLQRLHILRLEFQSTVAEGFRLLEERGALNKFIAATAQSNRYQDMALRLTQNDALSKFQNSFASAARYAWLAAKAYDYETGLSVGDPAAATTIMEKIVQARRLGLWADGEPAIGKGGLGEALAQMKGNFDVLRGQLGLNNPDWETDVLSLRYEQFRISKNTSSDERWKQALEGARVDDLWQVPEFTQYCRPFADPADGAQPGIVLEFSTEITSGLNVFGRELGAGDHGYSVSNFATKIASHTIWFEDYDESSISTTPRVYLVPVGNDVMRLSNSEGIETRSWDVVEQRIPIPYLINEANLNDFGFIPSLDGINGAFGERQRIGDSLAQVGIRDVEPDPTFVLDSNGDQRLVGRSVWNTRWLLIIPGVSLHGDATTGLDAFVDSVTDIQLQFETYSHEGY